MDKRAGSKLHADGRCCSPFGYSMTYRAGSTSRPWSCTRRPSRAAGRGSEATPRRRRSKNSQGTAQGTGSARGHGRRSAAADRRRRIHPAVGAGRPLQGRPGTTAICHSGPQHHNQRRTDCVLTLPHVSGSSVCGLNMSRNGAKDTHITLCTGVAVDPPCIAIGNTICQCQRAVGTAQLAEYSRQTRDTASQPCGGGGSPPAPRGAGR